MIPISIGTPPPKPEHHFLLDYGFRLFFVAAGFSAVLLMLPLLFAFAGDGWHASYYGPLLWHGHEMLYGFTSAVIAGFLLTAVRNWTQLPTLSGRPLLGLLLLWLAGRIAALLPIAPNLLVSLLDLAFLPWLAYALWRPIATSEERHNLTVPLLLLAMALCNGGVHLELFGVVQGWALPALHFSVWLVLLLIALIAGRVVPFFTRQVLPEAEPITHPQIEQFSLVSLLLLAVADLSLPAYLVALLTLAAAAVHTVRLWGWQANGLWQTPMLAILHLGYLGLIVGLLLHAAAALGLYGATTALHMLTAGAIGVFTLGMMTRVTAAHSGRRVTSSPMILVSFLMLAAAALLRVALPESGVSHAVAMPIVALLWIGAFAFYLWRHLPWLLAPRADGRPG